MADKEPTVIVRTAKKKGRTVKTRAGAPPPRPDPAPELPEDGAEGRDAWGSKIGFIFAAIGSAIGLGSIVRFPFITAENGGAAFVLIYAGIMLLVGVPMMMSEFALGRRAQRNPVGVFKVLRDKDNTKWRIAGFWYLFVTLVIMVWYTPLVGWVLRYIFASITGSYFGDPVAYFAEIQEGPDALLWTFLVLALVALVVARGISGGIEKINLIMIPSIFAIIVGLVVYAATLAGGSSGYSFYLEPDWGDVSGSTIKAAVAQAFFSLSLGSGAMIVYASYLGRKENLASNALTISVSTLGFAFLAGLMVFPMLSAFGLLEGAAGGIGLIFGPLPAAFASMGQPLGNIVGSIFFLGTFFAAFTSAIALVEPATSYLKDEWHLDRKRATILVCEVIMGLAILAALDSAFLNLAAGNGTDLGVLVGGIFVALFVGTVLKGLTRDEMDTAERGPRVGRVVYPLVRFVLPLVLVVMAAIALFGNPAVAGLEASDGFIDDVRNFLNGGP